MPGSTSSLLATLAGNVNFCFVCTINTFSILKSPSAKKKKNNVLVVGYCKSRKICLYDLNKVVLVRSVKKLWLGFAIGTIAVSVAKVIWL